MTALEGRVALVTGATSGIGRAAAVAFAAAGARVVATGRNRERGEAVVSEIRGAGGDGCFVAVDLTEAGAAARVVAAAVRTHGRLDCAFNNAAAAEGAGKSVADFSEEEFDHAMAINLRSVWTCMKAELSQMVAQSPAGGAIVNTSSVNGLGGARQGALYSAAKAGVLALTKSAAQEYAAAGIRVNALVAGAFLTPMLEGVFASIGGPDPEAQAAVRAQYERFIPLGRLGAPDEAAAAAVWLCSDAASYVTGHSMLVDGGMTAMMR